MGRSRHTKYSLPFVAILWGLLIIGIVLLIILLPKKNSEGFDVSAATCTGKGCEPLKPGQTKYVLSWSSPIYTGGVPIDKIFYNVNELAGKVDCTSENANSAPDYASIIPSKSNIASGNYSTIVNASSTNANTFFVVPASEETGPVTGGQPTCFYTPTSRIEIEDILDANGFPLTLGYNLYTNGFIVKIRVYGVGLTFNNVASNSYNFGISMLKFNNISLISSSISAPSLLTIPPGQDMSSTEGLILCNLKSIPSLASQPLTLSNNQSLTATITIQLLAPLNIVNNTQVPTNTFTNTFTKTINLNYLGSITDGLIQPVY